MSELYIYPDRQHWEILARGVVIAAVKDRKKKTPEQALWGKSVINIEK